MVAADVTLNSYVSYLCIIQATVGRLNNQFKAEPAEMKSSMGVEACNGGVCASGKRGGGGGGGGESFRLTWPLVLM